MSAKDLREIADMQRSRGHAYSLLKVGDKQTNLKRAIVCYEKALQIYTREDFPEECASIQYDLGNTYQNLPGSDRQSNLERAISYYQQALQVYLPGNEVWAIIQLRLGDAYRNLPAGNQQANLWQAINYYQKALQAYTRDDFPTGWAMTRFRLGEAFRNLLQGDQQTNLQIALTHYQSTLQVYTRKAFPREWAQTQRSLGDTYYNLRDEGPRASPTSPVSPGPTYSPGPTHVRDRSENPNFRDAIFCYQAALQVYTREDYPLEWAITQYALGKAYRDQNNLVGAITCFQEVLQVRTLENSPIEWAQTQRSLGDVYHKLQGGDRQANFEQAVACYENALQVYTRNDFPDEWHAIRLEEGIALSLAGDAQIARGEQLAALQSYQQALAILRQIGQRTMEAGLFCKIGDVQLAIGGKQRNIAMTYYVQALTLYEQERDFVGEANALRRMGDVDKTAAEESYQRASDLLQLMPHSPEISRLLAQGDAQRETARQSYEQALTIFSNRVGNLFSTDALATRKTLADLEQLRVEKRDPVQRRIDEQRAAYEMTVPGATPSIGAPPTIAGSAQEPYSSQPYAQQASTSPLGTPVPPTGFIYNPPARQQPGRRRIIWITLAILVLVLIVITVFVLSHPR